MTSLSRPRNRWPWFPVMLLAVPGSMAILAEAAATDSQEAEPVVLLEAGAVQACGIRAEFHSNLARRFELLVRREGQKSHLVIRTSAVDPGTQRKVNGTAECSPSLTTLTQSTRDLMSGAPLLKDGFIELSAPAENDTISKLIHELMLRGGTFSCDSPAVAGRAFILRGPLPQQTRAAYLNCSGDLFRPEEER